MELLDWSDGCVCLGRYVDIIPIYPGYNLLHAHRFPVHSIAAIRLGNLSGPAPFFGCIKWRENVNEPAAAADPRNNITGPLSTILSGSAPCTRVFALARSFFS